jgi:hypothetical protein
VMPRIRDSLPAEQTDPIVVVEADVPLHEHMP